MMINDATVQLDEGLQVTIIKCELTLVMYSSCVLYIMCM